MPTNATTTAGPRNIYPEVIYEDLPAALSWLVEAFGFMPGRVAENAEGRPVFAELHVGSGTLLARGQEQADEQNPLSLGGRSQQLYVRVDDTDAHHDHASAAGARIVMPPTDMPFGARLYSAHDPEGHLWTFGTYEVRTDS